MITPKELEKIKDIACDFMKWKDANTTPFVNGTAHLAIETGKGLEFKRMTYEELFDHFVHEMLTEIEIEKMFGQQKDENNGQH